MMRFFCGIFGVILLTATPVAAQAPAVIPPSGAYVTDHANMLTSVEEASLTQRLRSFDEKTSTQIVVVTLPDLGGADEGAYATELGEQWGVGQAGKDNGIVILVSRDDREVFIATGFGLEGEIPDAVAARIVRNVIVPNFRRGNYYVGLERAVDVLMEAAGGRSSAVEPKAAPESEAAPAKDQVVIPNGVFVIDRADLLTPAEENALTQRLREYENSTGEKIGIVTLPDTDQVVVTHFAPTYGDHIIVVSPKAWQGRIIVRGRESQVVVSRTLVRRVIEPNFRERRYYAGLSGIVEVLTNREQYRPPPEPEVAAPERTTSSQPAPSTRSPRASVKPPPSSEHPPWVLGLLLFCLLLVILACFGLVQSSEDSEYDEYLRKRPKRPAHWSEPWRLRHPSRRHTWSHQGNSDDDAYQKDRSGRDRGRSSGRSSRTGGRSSSGGSSRGSWGGGGSSRSGSWGGGSSGGSSRSGGFSGGGGRFGGGGAGGRW